MNNLLNNKFFCFAAIFSFLKPAGFDFLGFNTLNTSINIARIIFAAIIFINYFSEFRRLSKLLLSEMMLFSVFFISTIYNNEETTRLAIFSVSVLAFTSMVELYAKRNPTLFISILFFNYLLIIGTNLLFMLSIIGLQRGSDELFAELTHAGKIYNILSSDNMSASFTFPALCSGFLYSFIKGNKYNVLSWILYLLVLATIIMLWSATSLVGATLALLYILISGHVSILKKMINANRLFLIAFLLLLGFTFFGIQEWFSYVIVDILNKNLTMTGRTSVWQIGLKGFSNEPFLGKGFNVMTIDNGLIQILYAGGLFSLIIFVLFFFIATKKLRQNTRLEIDKFFVIIITTVLLMSICESWYFFFGFFMILALSYNSHAIYFNIGRKRSIPMHKK
jgi:O-antigen ligase